MTLNVSHGNQKGFSLLEVAIALLIIGIIVGTALMTYNNYRVRQMDNDTKTKVEIVKAALNRFVVRNGRYPFPADRDIAIGATGFGVEVAAAPTLACGTNPGKACVTTGVTNVFKGDVPFATLGIRYDSILDSYGSKLTYAVTSALTATGTFTDGGGVIALVYSAGPVATAPFNHYFVFSSGPDRQGGYALSGTSPVACGVPATNGTDTENCDGNNVFRSNLDNNNASLSFNRIIRNFADGATQFDDWGGFTATSRFGLWSETAGLGQLVNTNGGNVLVGAPSFCGATCVNPPMTKLEVNGVVRATGLNTGRICYNNSGNCPIPSATLPRGELTPQHFAFVPTGALPNTTGGFDSSTQGNSGGGIRCASNRALRGFWNGDELCANSIRAANPNSFNNSVANGCNTAVTGLYATGITAAGAVKCN